MINPAGNHDKMKVKDSEYPHSPVKETGKHKIRCGIWQIKGASQARIEAGK